MRVSPVDYLQQLGFQLDLSVEELCEELVSVVDASRRDDVRTALEAVEFQEEPPCSLYSIPQNLKEAAILFSMDWPAAEAAIGWFANSIRSSEVRSLAEMGCGVGTLLGYLRCEHPDLVVRGVEAQANLADIAKEVIGHCVVHSDYLLCQADQQFDMVVCSFGWDNSSFDPSETPHSSAFCGGVEFCLGCSDDFSMQLNLYLSAWRRWAKPDAPLVICGRLRHFSDVRAFALAAEKVGWLISLSESTILKVINLEGELERFPALVFRSSSTTPKVSMDDVGRFWLRAFA